MSKKQTKHSNKRYKLKNKVKLMLLKSIKKVLKNKCYKYYNMLRNLKINILIYYSKLMDQRRNYLIIKRNRKDLNRKKIILLKDWTF